MSSKKSISNLVNVKEEDVKTTNRFEEYLNESKFINFHRKLYYAGQKKANHNNMQLNDFNTSFSEAGFKRLYHNRFGSCVPGTIQRGAEINKASGIKDSISKVYEHQVIIKRKLINHLLANVKTKKIKEQFFGEKLSAIYIFVPPWSLNGLPFFFALS